MIKHDDIYAKLFVSNNLTRQKYWELFAVAETIRELKNIISQHVCQNIYDYLDAHKYEFQKEMRQEYYHALPSSLDKECYDDVLTAYHNKFEAIRKKLTFEHVRYIRCEVYKRDSKNGKKGGYKKTKNKRKQTPLTVCLSYLARYGNPDSVQYIRDRMPNETLDKQKFYESILTEIEKFGFDRLFRLALSKREQAFARYASKPIEFKSLTFRGRSRKKTILAYNKTYGSVINAFVSLSGFERKSFDIPVKFAKDYHGNIHDYDNGTDSHEYIIKFNERRKQVTVILMKKDDRYYPDAGDNIVGIDVNVKHNMFTLSDGTTYDYDRQLLKDYAAAVKRVDKLKAANKDYKVGKRRQWKIQTIAHKIVESEKQRIAVMCAEEQAKGTSHFAMEDLDGKFEKSYVKDKCNDDLNFNRIVKALRISSLKNEVEHIARKYDIAVSTVHASYTSKMCPVCGCIEDENRPTQEEFSCIECGHENNADVNAAINIRNRVAVTVLRNKLLKQLDNGAFEPKKLKREKVKEVLESFRRSLLKSAGSERSGSVKGTFDYV